eukprot:s2278_g8.t1
MQDCIQDVDRDVFMLKSQAAETKNELKDSPGATGASWVETENVGGKGGMLDQEWTQQEWQDYMDEAVTAGSWSDAPPASSLGDPHRMEKPTTWITESGEKYELKTVWVPTSDDGNSGSWIEAWVNGSHLQQPHGLDDDMTGETELDDDEGDSSRTSNQLAAPPSAGDTMDTNETGDTNNTPPAATPGSEKVENTVDNENEETNGSNGEKNENEPVITKGDHDDGIVSKGEGTETKKGEGDQTDGPTNSEAPQIRIRQKRPASDMKAGLHEVSWVPLTETGFRDFMHACQHGHTVSESQDQRVAAVNTEPKPTESVKLQPARGYGTFQEFFRCQAPLQNAKDMTLEKLIEDCQSMDYVTPSFLVAKGHPPHVAETMAYINHLRIEWDVTEPVDVLWWLKRPAARSDKRPAREANALPKAKAKAEAKTKPKAKPTNGGDSKTEPTRTEYSLAKAKWKSSDIFKAMIEEMGQEEAKRRRYI